MSQIELEQAKTRLDDLIEQAARGEEVLITKNHQPVARLSAVVSKRQRQFGSARGHVWMSDDFDAPLDDLSEYM